jgi:hypothetical protein
VLNINNLITYLNIVYDDNKQNEKFYNNHQYMLIFGEFLFIYNKKDKWDKYEFQNFACFLIFCRSIDKFQHKWL